MTRCALGLGSNLGDRAGHLRWAFHRLARLPRTRLLRRSVPMRSKAVGPGRQRDYFNAAALIETGLSPMGLLIELKRLEVLRGRQPGRRWRPRRLDLDILTYGKRNIKYRFLVIPHPRAQSRAFVQKPLAGLRPYAPLK